MGQNVRVPHNSHISTLRAVYYCTSCLIVLCVINVLRTQFRQLRSRVVSDAPAPTKTNVASRPISLYYNDERELIACSIPNACLRMYFDTRVLFVPNEYRKHEEIIRRCHNFVESPQYPRSFDPMLQYYDPNSSKNPVRWDLRRPVNVDALGISFNGKYFSHFAHFAADFLEYAMIPASLFIGKNRNIVKPPGTIQCIYPDGSSTCDERLLPRYPRIVIGTDAHKWTMNFLRKITDVNKTVHVAPHTFAKPTTCFRSLIISPLKYDAANRASDRLLQNAGIQRTPRQQVNVVILMRPPWAARGTPRSLVLQLRNQLRKQLDNDGSTNVTIETGSMVGLEFDAQLDLMQRADILVSPHGAELSNTLFLRRSTTVFEIFPFGWVYRQYFTNILKALHVKRIEVVSQPDEQRFYRCAKDRKLDKNETELYARHVQLYRNAHNLKQQNAAADFTLPDPHIMGSCIRYQLTTFNVTSLANMILTEVHHRQQRKT